MTGSYDKYFSNQDTSSAKAVLMHDIKDHIIYGTDLSELIDDLGKNGMLEEKKFTREPKGKWSDEYARFLANSFASGYFSREYLNYCAEVAEYLFQKNRRSKILVICGIASLIIIGLIIAF
jgi:ABC-type dipeptide/oligopeptide/nickel transport system permease component